MYFVINQLLLITFLITFQVQPLMNITSKLDDKEATGRKQNNRNSQRSFPPAWKRARKHFIKPLKAIIYAAVDHPYCAQRLTGATLLQKLYLVHNSRSLMMMRLAH